MINAKERPKLQKKELFLPISSKSKNLSNKTINNEFKDVKLALDSLCTQFIGDSKQQTFKVIENGAFYEVLIWISLN